LPLYLSAKEFKDRDANMVTVCIDRSPAIRAQEQYSRAANLKKHVLHSEDELASDKVWLVPYRSFEK